MATWDKHCSDVLGVVGQGTVTEDVDIRQMYSFILRETKRRYVPVKGEYPLMIMSIGMQTGLYELEYKGEVFGLKLFHFGGQRQFYCLMSVGRGKLSALRQFIKDAEKYKQVVMEERGQRFRDEQHKCKQTKVHVIGSDNKTITLKPQTLVLEENLRDNIWRTVFSVYEKGKVYKRMGLPPFKKVLLSGLPGTGKTITCQHLAKAAIKRGIFVVYVSAQGESSMFGRQSRGSFDRIMTGIDAINKYKLPALLIVEEFDTYLYDANEKNKILNFLDGFETPFKTLPVCLVLTTNNPESIDPRILNRRGRINRVFEYGPISSVEVARQMADYYFDGLKEKEQYKEFMGLTGDLVKELAVEVRIRHADDDPIPDFPSFVREFCKGLAKKEEPRGYS